MPQQVFLSYRRKDSAGETGRIRDYLAREFGQDFVVMDVDPDAIPLASDFEASLNTIIGRVDVVIAVIGPQWLDARDDRLQRRLDNPTDIVRMELRTALQQKLPVIPVLVDEAPSLAHLKPGLPTELAELTKRQGISIRRATFLEDAKSIVRFLKSLAFEEYQKGCAFFSRQDYAKALQLFEKASRCRISSATFNLATMHEEGIGTPRNYARALKLYQISAEEGNAAAYTRLGHMAAEGLGMVRSIPDAVQYYETAAEQGDPEAMLALSNLYFHGLQGEQDIDSYLHWMEKAVAAGNLTAMADGGLSLVFSGDAERQKGLALLEHAAKSGSVAAMLALGSAHAGGKGSLKGRDYAAVHHWYVAAEKAGSTEASLRLGELYRLGQGVPKNSQIARHYFESALSQGNQDAHCFIGELFASDDSGEPGLKKALECFEKGAAGGSCQCMYALADAYEIGRGCRKSKAKADYWQKRANEQSARESMTYPRVLQLSP